MVELRDPNAFLILAVDGEWLELHGCGICHAVGEDPPCG